MVSFIMGAVLMSVAVIVAGKITGLNPDPRQAILAAVADTAAVSFLPFGSIIGALAMLGILQVRASTDFYALIYTVLGAQAIVVLMVLAGYWSF